MHSASEKQGPIHAHSVQEAAKSIGISRSMLYRLISANTIRTFKIGKRVLVADSELQRFVQARMGVSA